MTQSGKIITQEQSDYADLLCPRCKANNLHHTSVSVYERSEDAPEVLLTIIENRVTTTRNAPSVISGNPSRRCDGIVISFWCEQCGEGEQAAVHLQIGQHKGSTEVSWIFSPATGLEEA